MAGRYVMTPARRAALKKAQAASAAKRRGSGRAKSKAIRKQKKAYAKKNYRGRGGYSRRFDDLKNSKGPVYSQNNKGKKYGKWGKRANKAAAYYSVSPVALAVSRKRAKKRSKKRSR